MKRERYTYKEWFLIHKDGVSLGVVCGDAEAKAALDKYPGARRRGYKTLKAAMRAMERGLDDEDGPVPLF